MKSWTVLLVLLLVATAAEAFPPAAGGEKKCSSCHQLSVQEAGELLKGGVDRVLRVEQAEVPALWAVEVIKSNQKFLMYIDYSKKYIFNGSIIRLADHQNITSRRLAELNKVDVSKIPLGDALLLGDAKARTKVIVFTDPECPFCKRLHTALQEVVKRDPDIAFWIKLFPLKMHPNAYAISKSIVCNRSMELLEASFAGKPVPPPLCEAKAIDDNIALAQTLGINSTPTLILPDGLVVRESKGADDILRLLGSNAAPGAARPR
ncbi:MAG: DsbC family protein [Desulfuromonadales bacterium]|nr:DsbC family protein [Desulfuromonadales bacterium]